MLYYLIKTKIKIRQIIFTYWIYFFYSFLNGIQIKRKCKFYGNTKFLKFPGSIIAINSNCRFRSDLLSNTFGLYRINLISTLSPNASIVIGENSGFSGTAISCAKSIKIGRNVLCGANVTITDTDWHSLDGMEPKTEDIKIEDNVWIGANAIILKGVKIGKGAVIGAGSVVAKSIPSMEVWAGNPAVFIKKISNND